MSQANKGSAIVKLEIMSEASVSNAKMKKGAKSTDGTVLYIIASLDLAPNDQSGYNVCLRSTKACRKGCNQWHSGRRVTKTVRASQIRKTRWVMEDRAAAIAAIDRDLARLQRKADKLGVFLYVRLNCASDLPWEDWAPELFKKYKEAIFYDYTKIVGRIGRKNQPENYHLTYSVSEESTQEIIDDLINRGHNVAVAMGINWSSAAGKAAKLPSHWRGIPSVNGDIDDRRTPDTDGRGVAVLMKWKGGERLMNEAIASGFAQKVTELTVSAA